MAELLYENVAGELMRQIEQGTYAPGERLPGVRRLRLQFGVSIATVVAACELLEQREVLEARPRSGFFVRSGMTHLPEPEEATAEFDGPSLVSGQERVLELVQSHNDPAVMSFGAAAPVGALLPSAALDRSFARVRRRQRERAAAYDFPPGCPELRVQIARRMAQAGCQLGPDDIVLTAGCQDALLLALRAVAAPGDVIAIESPAFYGILQAIESQGMRALEITTDPVEGMVPGALERALAHWPIRACVMMPSFGNPLGHLASEARKTELVALLQQHDVPLIEDDVFGELGFQGPRPWAAKAYDANGNVLYCSSFSKTLGAGLRVGWIAPGRYRERVTYLKYATGQATPSMPALAVADYLEQGGYDRFLRSLRRRLEQQVQHVINCLRQHFPADTRLVRPRGGFVVWVALPAGHETVELQHRARAAGISFAPGPFFSPTGRYRNYLRLSCTQPWTTEVEEGLARLGALACAGKPPE